MVPCALCDKTFTTFNRLKNHMSFYHKTVSTFSCASTGCLRSFQIFNSYRRHYLKNHTISSELLPHLPPNISQQNNCENINAPSSSSENVNNSSNSTINTTPALEFTLAQLFSTLYANPQVPQNVADTVFNGIKDIFDKSLLPRLIEQDGAVKATINNALSNLDSYYKRLKYFKEQGSYIEPSAYTVGRRYDFVKSGGIRLYKALECKAHFIPLRIILKKFFCLPNILQKTLQHINKLKAHDSTQTLEHFMHGSFWRGRLARHGNKLVLPMFLQVDDFEPLNALGSHSSIHKLGAAYISLPCLPDCYASQLSNIFLVLLYHSSDRIQFGNRVIFQPLIDEFNYLIKQGLDFDLPDFNGTIFFELALILGDNLGLHSITGFVESFSSNFSCRNCKVSKNNMAQLFQEDATLLRNMDNYMEDLRTNNVTLTGVKHECIWLRVENFDLFSQIGVDVMHDLNEGVMKYIMSEIIVALVDKEKFFSLQLVNNKLASFDYGPDNVNRPVSLSIEHLRKGNMRLSSSEMSTFCRYFGIMFGDLVPRDNKYWALYIQLMLLLDVVMSSRFRPESTIYLQHLVYTLCEMYTTLFNQNLKPKFHNLLHYHSAMLKYGPLRYLSSMRFEAKHHPSKLASKSSLNRINMTFTIAKSHQLTLNDIFLKGELKEPYTFGAQTNVSLGESCVLAQNFCWNDVEKIKSTSWALISSTRFYTGCVVVHRIEPHIIHFAIIHKVYVYNNNNVVFKAKPMETINFDDHYFAYNVEDAGPGTELVYINYDSMQYPYACNLVIVGCGVHPLQYVILRKPL
jgi:hypothetical protein